MYRPNLIANYFIKKSLDTGQPVTPMKLLKLVYIAHGWYLALTGDDLINEGVQAWKYGPVIPSVYHKFKMFGNKMVTSTLQNDIPEYSSNPWDSGVDISDLSVLSEEVKRFLDKIWEVYGKLDGVHLSTLTHQEDTPWDIVWNKMGGKDQRCSLIPNDIIKDHYTKKRTSKQNG